jgi:hypothetical protein
MLISKSGIVGGFGQFAMEVQPVKNKHKKITRIFQDSVSIEHAGFSSV